MSRGLRSLRCRLLAINCCFPQVEVGAWITLIGFKRLPEVAAISSHPGRHQHARRFSVRLQLKAILPTAHLHLQKLGFLHSCMCREMP